MIRPRIPMRLAIVMAASLATLAGLTTPYKLSAAEPFYQNKTITVISYAGPSGGYTFFARLFARHLPKHMEGSPNAIVKNMVGAGGLTATRYLYEAAPRDGTVIGTISRGIPFEPLLGQDKVSFDPLQFNWIGSMSSAVTIFIGWHTASVKTARDLFERELMIAGTGAGADSEVIPGILNRLFGTKFKVISGYKDVTEASLAMERGEVEGMYWGWASLKNNYAHWLQDKKVNVLLQARFTPFPEIADVPLVTTLARNERERQIVDLLFARELLGHPMLAPPAVPTAQVAALRRAFEASYADPALVAEAEKSKMHLELTKGEEIAATIRRTYAIPQEVIRQVTDALGRH